MDIFSTFGRNTSFSIYVDICTMVFGGDDVENKDSYSVSIWFPKAFFRSSTPQ
jgi:hypothetical protein